MFKILKSNSFFKNLVLSVFTLFLLCFFWLKWLDLYTDHNTFIVVPSLYGIHFSDLDSIVDHYGLKYTIIDSVFDKSSGKGLVVNQDPLPYTDVKMNRQIYITINSMKAKTVLFPDIFDLTLRQAVSSLKKNGLEVGNLEYQVDIATNKVLAFKLNGTPLKIGQELYYGSIIDLVVGQGLGDKKVVVPNLLGLTSIEANIILKSTSLNIGLEYFNSEVLDSNSAIIYKQYPKADDIKAVKIGSAIDLYYKLTKLDSLK